MVDAEVIVGNPSQCVEMIAQTYRRYKPDHLILLMGFRGITNEQVNSVDSNLWKVSRVSV